MAMEEMGLGMDELEGMKERAMQRQGEVEQSEDELYAAASPKGRFSGKALNALVDAANRLTPLFGITEKYEKFGPETLTELPPAFIRLISMFSKAISDAIDDGSLSEDAGIDITTITDDSGLQGLAGRLNMAAKSPQFKKFLKSPKKTEVEVEINVGGEGEEEEGGKKSPEEMSAEETDAMFASRM